MARDTSDPSTAPETPELPHGIFAFARGPAAGNCLHAILEQLAWDQLDTDATRDLVQTTLTACGLSDSAAHRGDIDPTAVIVENLHELAEAQAQAGGPTFAQLCSGESAAEWQFTLPTENSPTGILAEHFRHSASPTAQRYADRLAELPPRLLHGFLTGFVDYVGEHDGRYWVIDWKSNHLGNEVTAYGEEAVQDAMHSHDYVLQYHLYVLALHRQLQRRRPDYDYERHFGGVSYAFLRGAVRGSANGMFFDRPPKELIEAMDQWAQGQHA